MRNSKNILIISTIAFLSLAYTQNLFAQNQTELRSKTVNGNRINYLRPMATKINKDDFLKLLNNQPSFAIYKDNYFITGVPLNEQINKNTADAKFQISMRQRLTKSVLPFNTFLMLTYTQKSFWDIYIASSPFKDNNYNPGLALIKPIIYNDMFRGMASLAIEHESNGKDGADSRSVNYFVLSGIYYLDQHFSIQLKLWDGIVDKGKPEITGDGNPDLYKYRGYGLMNFSYRTLNDKYWITAMINPHDKFKAFNTQLEFNFKLSQKANQYLFVQWYQGYGESQLDYKDYSSKLRVGICIKSPMGNLY